MLNRPPKERIARTKPGMLYARNIGGQDATVTPPETFYTSVSLSSFTLEPAWKAITA